jgi:Uma2 family endonuclease
MSSAAGRLDGYTLADWENLEPVEGHRIELVHGRLVVNAAPAPRHQRVADRLCRLLDNTVAPHGLEALTAIGIRVGQLGYIPDIVVSTPIDDDATTTNASTVTLVVEVVSPSTAKTDRLEKPAAYAAAGIPTYWRVELPPGAPPVVYCYQLDDDVYTLTTTADTTAITTAPITTDITVTLDVNTLTTTQRTR